MSSEMIKAYSHEQLFKMIVTNKLPYIIDVRDIDFGEGGMIRGAVNIPSFEFSKETINEIISHSITNNINDIVCYCKFGKARSVQSSALIQSQLQFMKDKPELKVGYLQGGFKMFKAWYNDTDVIVPEKILL